MRHIEVGETLIGVHLRTSRCGDCLRIAAVNEVPATDWFPATATLLSTVDCPRLVRRRTTKCQHRPTVRTVIRPAPCPLSLTVNDSQSRVGGSGSTSPARSSSGAKEATSCRSSRIRPSSRTSAGASCGRTVAKVTVRSAYVGSDKVSGAVAAETSSRMAIRSGSPVSPSKGRPTRTGCPDPWQCLYRRPEPHGQG